MSTGSCWPGAGTLANALHSAGILAVVGAWRALAAYITSVRTLIASTSARSRPAPSAMPRNSSRYAGMTLPIGASNRAASRRTVGQSQSAKWAKIC